MFKIISALYIFKQIRVLIIPEKSDRNNENINR